MAVNARGSETHVIGDVTVSKIVEQILPLEPNFMIPDWDPTVLKQHWDVAVPDHYDPDVNKMLISIHSWLIRTARHTILIDACCGNNKERPTFLPFHHLNTPFLQRLNACGVSAESVDYVLCTHLHMDHVGWNTVLRNGQWVPTFPNARYIVSRTEYEHWAGTAGKQPLHKGVYEDSVLPVVEAGLAQIVNGDEELPGGLVLRATPGHTPGHIAVHLRGPNDEALFTGDIVHSPLQVYRPDWNSLLCEQVEPARATRRWMLDYAAERQALLCTGHFGGTSCGRVESHNHGFAWKPSRPSPVRRPGTSSQS